MKAPSPATMFTTIKYALGLFFVFSGSYMIFFSGNASPIPTPLKEITGFIILSLGLWLLFKGP